MSEEPAADAFFRFVVTHPVANLMSFAALIVFGWVSYGNLPLELMPDVRYPTITVRTAYEGAAPAEVEDQISRPLEESLATLDGLVTLDSRSRADQSEIRLGFRWGTDLGQASQAIREGLQMTLLPDGAGRPLILRYDPSLAPFLRLSLSFDEGEGPKDPARALARLREIADHTVARELEGLEGIAAVRVVGGLERQIHIDVREDWLAAHRVRLEDVRSALATQNVNLAGGSILEGDVEYLVRTVNEYTDLDDLRDVRIRRADGAQVRLTDVATVTEAHAERKVIAHTEGREAVLLDVLKEADANIVEVARRVQGRLGEPPPPEDAPPEPVIPGMPVDDGLRRRLPDGMNLAVLDDQAHFVESAIQNLVDAAIQGGILSIGITFLFLREFRSTFIISLAIPLSVIIGFGPMYLLGVSLNLMSLGGLALGVGIVVDSATVVLESIQVYLDQGKSRLEASVLGTRAVAAAVTASTFTTIAVYLPVAFIDGIAGELFGDLAVAVVASMAASLLVALLLVPALVALDASPPPPPTEGLLGALAAGRPLRELLPALKGAILDPPREAWEASRAAWTERPWRRVLWPYAAARWITQVTARAVGVPALVVAGGVALVGWRVGSVVIGRLAAVLVAIADAFVRWYDRQAERYDRFNQVSLRRPGAVLLAAVALSAVTVLAGRTLGAELVPEVAQGRLAVDVALPIGTPLPATLSAVTAAEQRLAAVPAVTSVHSRIGADPSVDAAADQGEHTAHLAVSLSPGVDEAQAIVDLRAAMTADPRLTVRVSRPALFAFDNPVEVVVTGYELDDLKVAGERLVARLDELPGLADAKSSLVRGYPEVQVLYHRDRLARLGLDPASVADTVRQRVQGVDATALRDRERRVDLRVQLAPEDRASLDDLRALNVNPTLVPPIPLDTVADLVVGEGPSEIRRVDQQRAVVVSANLSGFDLGTAIGAIDRAVHQVDLPPDTEVSIAGQARELEDSTASLWFAVALAVFLVYVVMAVTFEDVIQPLVVLFSVPMAGIGVVVTLWAFGTPFSIGVFLGLMTLAGVVVNNAIVLVDTVNRHLDEGMSPRDAIATAGTLRLRPILITSLTTIIGLIPLTIGYGEASEIQQPLAQSVMGGSTSSTVLTLVVVPAALLLVTRPRRPAAA